MEIFKHQKENEFIGSVLSSLKPSSSNLSRFSEVNRQSLKELINFLTNLKKDKIIDEKLFSELLIISCANFIENEVELRVSKSLSEKIMYYFEKL